MTLPSQNHIFNNPDYTVLVNQASLISHDKGFVQHYREAVEIYKYQHLGLALNIDSGDLRINESCFGFLKREADTLVIPERNVEPLPLSPNQIHHQPLRSQKVSTRNTMVKIRNQVT